jgi:hypothetical protein
VESRCGNSIRCAPAAWEAVPAVRHVNGTPILRRQSGADVRGGGRNEALRRFDERASRLGNSKQSGIRRIHVHDRPGRRTCVRHQVQSVVGFEPQVRNQQVWRGLANVLPGGDEITACRDIRDGRQRTLKGPSASSVGFDD